MGYDWRKLVVFVLGAVVVGKMLSEFSMYPMQHLTTALEMLAHHVPY